MKCKSEERRIYGVRWQGSSRHDNVGGSEGKEKRNSKKIAEWLHNGRSCILMMILKRSQWGKSTNYLTPHIMWHSCQFLLPRMHSNQKLLIICGCLVRHDCYAFILYVLILFPFLSLNSMFPRLQSSASLTTSASGPFGTDQKCSEKKNQYC